MCESISKRLRFGTLWIYNGLSLLGYNAIMLKVILALIVIVLAALMMQRFYHASSMALLSNGVQLDAKGGQYLVPYTERTNSRFLAPPLEIRRSKLRDGNGTFYYEVANIEGMYAFNHTPEKIARIVFDAQEARRVFGINGLYGVELLTAKGEVINMCVLSQESKSMHFLYGLSHETFGKIAKNLTGIELEHKGKELMSEEPLTHWSVEHITIDGIVSAIDH